jgi:hypothetical protein
MGDGRWAEYTNRCPVQEKVGPVNCQVEDSPPLQFVGVVRLFNSLVGDILFVHSSS